jgi:LysM repeat protein
LGSKVFGKFWHTIAYLRYTFSFRLRKAGLGQSKALFTTRFFFQLVSLGLLIGVAYPQTKLYAVNELGYNWQHIKLYGLTQKEFDTDQPLDFEIEQSNSSVTETVTSWRTEVVEPGSTGPSPASANQIDTLALAVGGRVIAKPLIIPGGEPRTRIDIENYTIVAGDSIPSIAAAFGVSVETILWENNLSNNDVIRPGKVLRIPPVTGVMYTIVRGDTVKKIADFYKAKPEDIIAFNKLGADGSGLVTGNRIMVPRGKKPAPAPTTAVAVVPRTTGRPGVKGVSRVALPQGAPGDPFTSGFIWPTTAKVLVRGLGFGHTGLDVATHDGSAFGRPSFAAQSGVVKFAGWNNGGYGNLIIIQHDNGFETYYGHHSQIFVSPGQYVERGQTIGAIGSTGRSTGPHLHFEIRINGKIVNPLDYVRPPA